MLLLVLVIFGSRRWQSLYNILFWPTRNGVTRMPLSSNPPVRQAIFPTDLDDSNIPEVWQSYRLRLRGKRTHWMNWWKKTFENLKLIKYPNWRRNWAIACSRSADRPGSNSASYWSALYTSATLRATSAASNLALYDQQSKRADVPIKHFDLNLYKSSD